MGDFDRTSSASGKPNETKKLVAVLTLGAVLVGLVAMQMMKRSDGAQPAAGAPALSNGVALPPPVVAEEISPNALARMTVELQNDPTKPLLGQNVHADHSLDAIPRNPFAMDDAWLASMVKPEVVISSSTQPYHPPAIPTTNAAPAATPRIEDYKLASIVNGDTAIINGKIVRVGDIVGKARVLQISEEGVILQSADSPRGPTVELSMSPRLNSGN